MTMIPLYVMVVDDLQTAPHGSRVLQRELRILEMWPASTSDTSPLTDVTRIVRIVFQALIERNLALVEDELVRLRSLRRRLTLLREAPVGMFDNDPISTRSVAASRSCRISTRRTRSKKKFEFDR